MNNWRLLLLALVAVLKPIASFTERSGFDGRQCCDRQLHSVSLTSNSFIDGSIRLDKAATEERRMNLNAIRENKQFETTLRRQSAERIRRQSFDSPTRLRAQYRFQKINTDNERIERHFSNRNYRITRLELDLRRLTLERNERTRNIRDVRSGNEIRRNIPLKVTRVVSKQERIEMSRREPSDQNIRRISRRMMSTDRRTFLREEARESGPTERKSLAIAKRSREYVIETRRSASLPNTRINNIRDNRNSEHRHRRVNLKQRQVIVQDVERRDHQSNQNRNSRNISVRRNQLDRSSTLSPQRHSVIQRDLRTDRNFMIQKYDINVYRHNIMQKRLATRQYARRVLTRSMDREIFINQDSELNHRTRSSVRRDSRDGSPPVKTTRSTESTRDVPRMQMKYETVRETTLERETVDIRNLKATRNREHFNVYQNQEQTNNQTNVNWLNILYTLQGIYLCALFMQIINGDSSKKLKSRTLCWWTPSSTSYIKVE